MRGALQRGSLALSPTRCLLRPVVESCGFRYIQVRAVPSEAPTAANAVNLPIFGTSTSAPSLDAQFDIIGSPYSMLSVSLSASQNLYTRRGTLVGLSGKEDNVVSTLKVLEPFRRAVVGIPFLYQKISSTTPITALVSVRSPVTSLTVVHLNGTVDWMVAQRHAILAWTGHSLLINPVINAALSIAHWGNSKVTGRGLLALVGDGQVYSVEVAAGERWIVHPSNIVAYTITSHPPQPYRFKSTSLRFQIPDLRLSQFLSRYRFFRDMAGSDTWKAIVKMQHNVRTWARRTIWGDRLFLQFEGPVTVLVQSRASRVRDVLSNRQVNEIADGPAGVAHDAIDRLEYRRVAEESVSEAPVLPSRTVEELNEDIKGVAQTIATIRDGKVEFEKAKQTPHATTTTRGSR